MYDVLGMLYDTLKFLLNWSIFLKMTSGWFWSPQGFPKKNFLEIAGARFLQAGWHSCHSTNSVKS